MRFFVSVAQDGSLNADDHYFIIDRYLKSFGRDSRGKDLVNLFSLGRIKESISLVRHVPTGKDIVQRSEKKYPEERRLVTVLFADVQGFTRLADYLDFEVVSDIIRSLWLKLDKVIEEYGGYIDKHIGDAFMVVWGAPQAREDDAERAVSAGMAILEAIEEHKRDATRPEAVQLNLRVGIHTGLALAGYVGLKGEYTVLGDTVNIAKRIEEQAEEGTVLISNTTYQFIRGAFRVKSVGSLEMRGKEEQIEAYQVIKALQHPSKFRYRSLGGLETNLVRREEELKDLWALYNRSQEQKQPQLALITGEIGVGKSRLMLEFAGQLELDEANLTMISSRALQQASKVPFFMWRTLWSNLFQMQEDDSPEVSREKFVEGVRSLWGQRLSSYSAIETAHILGDFVGIEWPQSRYLESLKGQPQLRLQRVFDLHLELFSRARSKGPLVLALDDLQWADQGSINLLMYLIQNKAQDGRILILGGGRPQVFTRYPQLKSVSSTIALKPLPISPDVVREAYPALEAVPEEVLCTLAERAEGNPFYLEELVKSMLNSGLESVSGEELSQWLPQSLRMLLQARLDALSPVARGVALLAAVVGRVFWRGAVLTALSKVSGTTMVLDISTSSMVERVQNAFDELMQAELAFPRAGSSFADEQEFIFKHSLLRDVAYSLLPRKYRGQCHLAIAQWLAARAGPELSIMVAEHYEMARTNQEAITYYQKAIQHARDQGNFQEAQTLEKHVAALSVKTQSS
jgi:class 3 adenylate cyclase